ncbi:DUF4238 domain-containing protein [Marinococcus luteus]|uniref:DUF4238 domain-containing protein n=1 Tax=Marinococcus luteus TaxID=1122204 RepID=UPI002ACCC1A0|nr:DUF4238 domain-containing protein [Marinococcus luteus]MDZ5782390.1 DUF4238 domain-containing protein [Marinococcus luteus]
MSKKSNHYVPQFYLKNFSYNRKSVGMYHVERKKYIPHASIKNVACKDYLYGKDGNLEDWFQVVESQASRVISNLIQTEKFPPKSSDDYKLLLIFILLSEARTLQSADKLEEMLSFLANKAAEYVPSLSKEEQEDRFAVKSEIPNAPGIDVAVKYFPVIMDLKAILIKTANDRTFMTSDNPVMKYNQMFFQETTQIVVLD